MQVNNQKNITLEVDPNASLESEEAISKKRKWKIKNIISVYYSRPRCAIGQRAFLK
jgi:hypothetical protein